MGQEINEIEFAKHTLERYSGSNYEAFQSNLLLTNFPQYVEYFSKKFNVEIFEGSMFKVAHCPKEDVTILDFKIGSPAAALVVDLCSFLNVRSALFLGMCGGLRKRYKIGSFIVPVASIRGEGTSDFYFPPEVPALANFLMSRATCEVLDQQKIPHHIGITYTTNLRFWEFNQEFIEKLKLTKAQAIELECATLFSASYKRKFTLGALLLISDLPLEKTGIKTKQSSKEVFENYMAPHIQVGMDILKHAREMQSKMVKGAYHRNLGLRVKDKEME